MNNFFQNRIFTALGRELIAIFFLIQSISYLFSPEQYILMLPDWISMPYIWVAISGVLWMIAAISFVTNYHTTSVGSITSIFMIFTAIIGLSTGISMQNIINAGSLLALAGGTLMIVSLDERLHLSTENGLFFCGKLLVGIFFASIAFIHFLYTEIEATLISQFPASEFWVVFTGVCFFAAALSLWSGIIPRIAATMAGILIIVISLFTIPNIAGYSSLLRILLTISKNIALIGCCIIIAARSETTQARLRALSTP